MLLFARIWRADDDRTACIVDIGTALAAADVEDRVCRDRNSAGIGDLHRLVRAIWRSDGDDLDWDILIAIGGVERAVR